MDGILGTASLAVLLILDTVLVFLVKVAMEVEILYELVSPAKSVNEEAEDGCGDFKRSCWL